MAFPPKETCLLFYVLKMSMWHLPRQHKDTDYLELEMEPGPRQTQPLSSPHHLLRELDSPEAHYFQQQVPSLKQMDSLANLCLSPSLLSW